MENEIITNNQEIEKLEQEFIETYREINGSYDPVQDAQEIYHYAHQREDWIGGDPRQKLMEIAHKWLSANQGLCVTEMVVAQKINSNAMNQYRDDLQR